MIKIINEEYNKIFIRGKADVNQVGNVLVIISFFTAALIFILQMILKTKFLMMLQVIPGILLLMGAIFMVIGGRTIVDTQNGTIKNPKFTKSLEDFEAIYMWSDVEVVDTGKGQSESLVYYIEFMNIGCMEKVTGWTEEINKKLGKVTGDEMSDSEEEYVLGKLRKIAEKMSGNTFQVAKHNNELKVWQAAEFLAKKLNLPIYDHCGEFPVQRKVEELDLSLQDKVKKGMVEVVNPEETPKGITANLELNGLSLHWKNGLNAAAITFLIIGAVMLIIGLFMSNSSDRSAKLFLYIFGGMGVFFWLLTLLFLKGFGKNVLKIFSGDVCYSCSNFMQRDQTMSLSKLEVIRASTELNFSLNLISDEEIIRCPMKEELSPWAQVRIEYFLKEGK